jgi:hypothetical protein
MKGIALLLHPSAFPLSLLDRAFKRESILESVVSFKVQVAVHEAPRFASTSYL